MWNKANLHRIIPLKRQLAGEPGAPEYLDHKFFAMTIGGALLLHVIAIGVWHLMPHDQVIDIPVRALNIKLSDGEPLSSDDIRAVKAASDNNNDVENALQSSVKNDEKLPDTRVKGPATAVEKVVAKPLDNLTPKAEAQDAPIPASEQKAKQFIRQNPLQATTKNLGLTGKGKAAEMMSRYEQLISLWIEKFKLYPAEAQAAGLEGATVVRIRIDRQGNVRYYILERSTGHKLLDAAAIDMVRRANPVPAVPTDYPPGDLIEFLIPVNFDLK